MTDMRAALIQARAGLEEAVQMETNPLGNNLRDVKVKLAGTLAQLLSDLEPLVEREVRKPAWLGYRDEVVDYEVLVLVSHELYDMFKEIQIEDSRSLQQVCIEAAAVFTEHHCSADEGYWDNRDFLEELETFCQHVRNALKAEPNWINKEHRGSFGKETVRDVLQRYIEQKYPMRLLDPIQGQKPPIMMIRINENLEVEVDLEEGKYKATFDQGAGSAEGFVSYCLRME
jgi:hypothetical protein